MEDYYNIIKGLRAKHNETQSESAKAIGMSVIAYRKREKGEKDFEMMEIIKLMKHWEEPLSQLGL